MAAARKAFEAQVPDVNWTEVSALPAKDLCALAVSQSGLDIGSLGDIDVKSLRSDLAAALTVHGFAQPNDWINTPGGAAVLASEAPDGSARFTFELQSQATVTIYVALGANQCTPPTVAG